MLYLITDNDNDNDRPGIPDTFCSGRNKANGKSLRYACDIYDDDKEPETVEAGSDRTRKCAVKLSEARAAKRRAQTNKA